MKTYFIALLIVLPSVLLAQTNYQPGYIVKSTGDTVKGYVDYREWDRSPKSVEFKLNKTDKNASEFDAQSIKAFGLTGLEHYISYTGLISMDKTSVPNLPIGLDTSKALQSIFMKRVTAGKHLALYQQKDDTKNRFFIGSGDGNIVELKYYQYYLDMEDKRNKDHYDNKVTEATYYKGQLIYYANQFNPGSRSLASAIEQIRFTEEDLKSIIDKINGGNARLTNQKRKKSPRFFVGAGANYTESEFHTVIYRLEPVSYSIISTTVSPKLNAGFDFLVNPNVQQLIFRAELTLSYADAKFTTPYNSFYSFKQYTTGIAPQFLFNIYNKEAFKFYVDGGISFNFSTYANSKLYFLTSPDDPQTPYKLNKYWASFPLQVGMVFNKRIELAFTYSGFTSYSSYDAFSISNRTMGVGLKYLLGK